MNSLEFYTDQELIWELERRGYLVAPRKPLDKRAKCDCGKCRLCKVREAVRRYRMRRGLMRRDLGEGALPAAGAPETPQAAPVRVHPKRCHYCEKEPSLVCVKCGTLVCIWHAVGSPAGMVCIGCYG